LAEAARFFPDVSAAREADTRRASPGLVADPSPCSDVLGDSNPRAGAVPQEENDPAGACPRPRLCPARTVTLRRGLLTSRKIFVQASFCCLRSARTRGYLL